MEDLKNEFKNDFKKDFKEVSSPKDWLSFDKMLSPVIIKIFFWIGVVASVIMGLITIFSSFGQFGSVMSFLGGLLIIVLGPVFVRVYCEIMIVVFKIHDSLLDIKKNTDK